MAAAFWVLFIWVGAGNSQAIATDHYATQQECEAAKKAVLDASEKMAIVAGFSSGNVMCIEANQ